MREIFEMQDGLQEFVFRKRGLLPWPVVRNDPERNTEWIDNFRKALSSEVCELYESTMKGDRDNAKIELVDILHFLVSLSLMTGVSARTAMTLSPDKMIRSYDETTVGFFLALDQLQNSCHWKWWSDSRQAYSPLSAHHAVRKLWERWWNAAYHLDMKFDQIKEIYMAKNRVNYERQINGYSAETKTEDDNQAIIFQMSPEREIAC